MPVGYCVLCPLHIFANQRIFLMTPNERKEYAITLFEQHPECFPENRRTAVLKGIIELGMTPFEAKLTAGTFTYRVIADPTHWPEHSDPINVMWAQSVSPDNSEIWMTFKNMTQFSNRAEQIFRVHFTHGKAVEIERLGE